MYVRTRLREAKGQTRGTLNAGATSDTPPGWLSIPLGLLISMLVSVPARTHIPHTAVFAATHGSGSATRRPRTNRGDVAKMDWVVPRRQNHPPLQGSVPDRGSV